MVLLQCYNTIIKILTTVSRALYQYLYKEEEKEEGEEEEEL